MSGKTLITGASGFIGSHLARALAARGDDLRVLARRSSDLSPIDGLSYERATGDVSDRRAVRRAMDGVERVFHVAGRTSLRPADREVVFAANLRGARVVFESALEAGVARVVHTSTAGAIGVAKPRGTADETTPFEIGHLGTRLRELEARGGARGLPARRRRPSRRDREPHLRARARRPDRAPRWALVRRFCLGQIPAYVDGALNIVDVRDVADGHLLADERGEVGERYILGARNFTFDRLFADLARISGVSPPPLRLPTRRRRGGRRGGRVGCARQPAGGDRLGLPVVDLSQHKARRELGFEPRPHEETLEDAVRWQLEELGNAGRAAAPTATCCARSVARSEC